MLLMRLLQFLVQHVVTTSLRISAFQGLEDSEGSEPLGVYAVQVLKE